VALRLGQGASPVTSPARALRVLSEDDCLRLLHTKTVGRLVYTTRALPAILPVTFALTGTRILIRTTPGAALESAVRDTVVAFQVDHIDSDTHTGWSVVVTGRARVVTGPQETARIDSLLPASWLIADTAIYLSVSVDLVSGRGVGPVDTGPVNTGPVDTGPVDTGPVDTERDLPQQLSAAARPGHGEE